MKRHQIMLKDICACNTLYSPLTNN